MKKKFTEIYQEILPDYISIDKLRKARNRMAIVKGTCVLIIVILILKLLYSFQIGNLFEKENIIWGLLLFFAILVNIKIATKTFDTKIEYNSEFKEKIIRPLIESYNGKLKYEPLGTEIENFYRLGNYEYYDFFFSEDYIHGDGIEMSEIRTEREECDENGIRHKYIIFQGLFSMFETSKFVSKEIEIVFDEGLDKQIFSQKVSMDSGEFEKYFDVYGAEKIEVMQILTSDVMEEIIKAKKKCRCKFSIKFVGNKILMRFYTGNVFEADKPGEEFEMIHLKYYYDIIDSTLSLSKYLINSVNQCEL